MLSTIFSGFRKIIYEKLQNSLKQVTTTRNNIRTESTNIQGINSIVLKIITISETRRVTKNFKASNRRLNGLVSC